MRARTNTRPPPFSSAHNLTIFLIPIRLGLMTKKLRSTKLTGRRYFKEVRFRQIRALVELARHGSFAAAAASVGIATPSLWQQVRALEDEFGVQFVVAKGTQVSLTDDGQTLVDLAAPLVVSFDSLRQIFDDRHRNTSRNLTVVAPAAILSGPLRKLIIDYRKQYPSVKLSLLDRPSFAARQVIENEEADLAIIGIAKGDEPLPQFQSWLLARIPYMLFCPKDHPLATMVRLKLTDISKQPLILSGDDTCNYRHIRHIFSQAGLADILNVTMTANNIALIWSYIAIGFGITISSSPHTTKLPKPAAGEKELIMRDVTSLFGHEEIFLIQRKGRYELPHVKAFRELVVKATKQE